MVACASAAEHIETYGGFELMEWPSCYGLFLLCFDVECVLRGLCGCGISLRVNVCSCDVACA